MLANLRSYLKKHLPPTSRAFKRGVKDIVVEVHKASDTATTTSARLHSEHQLALDELAASVAVVARQQDVAMQTLERVESTMEALERSADKQGRAISEVLWADVFRDTTSSSEWMRDRSFSPGRWAVGYPYLYVLYRVLSEIRPRRILELGLGQSTRMIAQYVEAHDDIRHVVVEHDREWIDFFARNYRLPDSTSVVKLDWGYVPFKEATGVRVYAGFSEALHDKQFDLISIDGPLGGDMKDYARIDVLGLLPECLGPSFVIMIDDCERTAESRTLSEMQNALSEAGIDYRSCCYSGDKDLGLLCSTDLAFLCSM